MDGLAKGLVVIQSIEPTRKESHLLEKNPSRRQSWEYRGLELSVSRHEIGGIKAKNSEFQGMKLWVLGQLGSHDKGAKISFTKKYAMS